MLVLLSCVRLTSSPSINWLNCIQRTFVRIETGSGAILLTPEHGVFARPCASQEPHDLLAAASLAPGLCLAASQGWVCEWRGTCSGAIRQGQRSIEGDKAVVGVALVEASGVYQPVTSSGGLVLADGTLISCFHAAPNPV